MSNLKKFIASKLYPLEPFIPHTKTVPLKMIDVPSAWKGLELIIEDLLVQFNIGKQSCIEFGVEFGFSSVVFSNFFETVKGVDIFIGDEHTQHKGNHFEKTKTSLESFKNIELFKCDYRDWISKDNSHYNFAHVDIVHNYKETYECGFWAAKHSECCIFHDTESFPSVRRAVYNIAKNTGKKAYNYPYHNGLGIIV